jgi:hypothetical protein
VGMSLEMFRRAGLDMARRGFCLLFAFSGGIIVEMINDHGVAAEMANAPSKTRKTPLERKLGLMCIDHKPLSPSFGASFSQCPSTLSRLAVIGPFSCLWRRVIYPLQGFHRTCPCTEQPHRAARQRLKKKIVCALLQIFTSI